MLGLGDAVCYLPFVQALRARFRGAEIVAVVASEAARDILEGCSAGIEIIVFNRGGCQRGWQPLLRLLWALRRRRFDVVISGAHPDSVRVPLFAFLCGRKLRIGANSERLRFLYNRQVEVTADAHYFDRYRLLLGGAGINLSLEEYRPTLAPPADAKEAAMQLWAKAGLSRHKVVIGLASGADVNSRGQWKPHLKRWDNQGYAQVARWATEALNAQVVMFGGPGEAALGDEIAAISGVSVVNMCGKTTLRQLQWLIRECDAFVSNDTGIMHMAGALGTPVVALFGPTSPASFRPPGDLQHVVEGHAPCSPCYPRPACDLTTCSAMHSILAPQVIDGISNLMGAKRSAAALQI
jgi:heptosyltransferase-2